MLEIMLENVRTFTERQQVPIRPLTILTGENSSGKSTFLAVLSAILDFESFPFAPGFNKSPYNLGRFDTIATYKGGKYGRAKTFTLGYLDTHVTKNGQKVVAKAVASYRSHQGQPQLASYVFTSGEDQLSISSNDDTLDGYAGELKIHYKEEVITRSFQIPQTLSQDRPVNWTNILLQSVVNLDDFRTLKSNGNLRGEFDSGIFRQLTKVTQPHLLGPVVSIAPIRSKPERTYDQLSDAYEPGGNHIPFVISRLLWKKPLSSQAKALIEALEKFGDESGLFQKFNLKRLGKSEGDPFQLMVNNGERDANLVDVGYGVSQALPVIVQSVMSADNSFLLLQQPEVHLHPRAQAALGSFFVQLASASRRHLSLKRIVISSLTGFAKRPHQGVSRPIMCKFSFLTGMVRTHQSMPFMLMSMAISLTPLMDIARSSLKRNLDC